MVGKYLTLSILILLQSCSSVVYRSSIRVNEVNDGFTGTPYSSTPVINPEEINQIDINELIGYTYLENTPAKYRKYIWTEYREPFNMSLKDVDDSLLQQRIYAEYDFSNELKARFVFLSTKHIISSDPFTDIYKYKIGDSTINVLPDDGYYFLIRPNYDTHGDDTFRFGNPIAYKLCLSPMLDCYDTGVYGSWLYFSKFCSDANDFARTKTSDFQECFNRDVKKGAMLLGAYYQLVLYQLYKPTQFEIVDYNDTSITLRFRSTKHDADYKLTTSFAAPYSFKVMSAE